MEKKSVWRICRAIVRGYWFSEEKWKARGLLAVVVALNFIAVGMLVLINDWYNEFYNSLQAYEYELFWPLVGKFAFLAFLHIAVAVYAIYLRQMLQIKWRSWLTERYLARWMEKRAYYKLETLAEGTDNPDQRISEDIGQFVELTLSLSVGFLKQLTTLAAFAVVLWNLSGVLTVPVGSWEFHIYGYMLWFSLIYSVLGTVGAHRVGRKLIGLNFERQRFEADFRFNMMRVRENSESIAFYGGEAQEVRGFKERFARVISNFWGLMRQTKILNFYINGYAQLAIIVPLIMAAPRYFGGEMALGGLMQTISAFGRVQDALSYFVEAYGSIAEYAAVVRRLSGFTAHMEEVDAKESAVAFAPSAGGLAVEGLSVSLPDGTELLKDCSFSLSAGEFLLVTGASGAGKSTLLRALAGLWPFACGRAAFPPDEKRLFLSQRPYLPLGTLARAVCYPLTTQGSRAEMERALRLVGMEAFLPRLNEVADWSHILSLGEQQRIAFARILLNRRNFLKNAVLLAAGAYVAPSLLVPEEAKAAVSNGVHVVETNLKFLELDKRSFTDSIILHHIGDSDNEVSAATIHQWHLQNGWSGIGYHFVVHKDGIIERGRPLDAVGAHCWHHNATSIGINLVGNFEKAEPTTVQLDSAMKLIAELSHRYKLKPGAGTVFGHRDFNSTLCPGKNLYGKLSGLCASAARL